MLGGEDISVSFLENLNTHHSTVAGFNWRNTPYPYWHKHQHWEILLVLDGEIQHKINNATQTAKKGYVCLLRPNDEHCIIFSEKKSEFLTFGFSDEIAKNLFALYPLNDDDLHSKEPLSFALQGDTLEAIVSKTLVAQFYPKADYEKYAVLIVNRLLLSYNEEQLKSTQAYPEWLNSFLFFVKNPKHLRLSIAELVKFMPYSYSHFSMLFKKYTGKTIVAYLQELKLMRAKELLQNTDYTVSEIVVDLNYESLSNFTHTFKRLTGLSPTAFRKASKF